MFGYSLEAPRRGASNEYPQHMFVWRNKKNLSHSYHQTLLNNSSDYNIKCQGQSDRSVLSIYTVHNRGIFMITSTSYLCGLSDEADKQIVRILFKPYRFAWFEVQIVYVTSKNFVVYAHVENLIFCHCSGSTFWKVILPWIAQRYINKYLLSQ